ncbi:MAG: response regulator [Pseudomonadales bacterium]|nr:response regulator [Pseudomonadales bacterium]
MHTDTNKEKSGGKEPADSIEDSQERALSWLLDMDLSDPEERLFAVEHSSQVDDGLTDYEMEVARRPMTRGSTGADNLESYIHEEIVMCSEGQGSDIYSGEQGNSIGDAIPGPDSSSEAMPIDYSRPFAAGTMGIANDEIEGADILGLSDNDEIGEKYFVVKRVKSAPENSQQPPARQVVEASSRSAEQAASDTSEASATTDKKAGQESKTTSVPAPVLRLVSASVPQPRAEVAAADTTAVASAAVPDAGSDELAEDIVADSSQESVERPEDEYLCNYRGPGLQSARPETDSAQQDQNTSAPLLPDGQPEDSRASEEGYLCNYPGANEQAEDKTAQSHFDNTLGDDTEVEEQDRAARLVDGELDQAGDGYDELLAAELMEPEFPTQELAGDYLSDEELSLEGISEEWATGDSFSAEAMSVETVSAETDSDDALVLQDGIDDYPANEQRSPSYDLSFEELALVPIEGEDGYEAPAVSVDEPQDMQAVAALDEPVQDNVTPLLPRLMDEMAVRLSERLAVLGMADGSVQSELKVAGDAAAVDQLFAAGFEPVIAICPGQLLALQELRQIEVDTIFLRLAVTDSGETCNQLFSGDYVAPCAPSKDAVAPTLEESVELETQAELATDSIPELHPELLQGPVALATETDDALAAAEAEAEAEAEVSVIFSDDVLAADMPEETDAAAWQPEDLDIEEFFADFSEAEEEAGVEALMAEAAEDKLFDAEQDDTYNVFAEDVFAADITADARSTDTAEHADIEAIFECHEAASGDSDEICGLDIQEFSEANEHLHLFAESAEAPASESQVHTESNFSVIPAGITFSQASPGGGEIFADFLEAFIEEGSSELEKLEDAVLAWEKDVASEAAFGTVSRILHTLKGIAKGVGLQFYGTLVHNFETLLGALPRPQAGTEGDYFRIVNAWLDACVRGLDHIQDTRADIVNELPQPAGQFTGVAQAVTETTSAHIPEGAPIQLPEAAEATQDKVVEWQEPVRAPQAAASASDARAQQAAKKIADDGARVLAAQQSVRITSEKLDHLLNLSNQAQQLSVRTAQSVTRSKRASSEMQSRLASVRAHIAAIADRALRSVAAQGVQPGAPMDALEMDQYSELQEAANILREGVEDLSDLVDFATRQNAQIEALLKQQNKVISSIGSSIRGARVVPVSRLVPGLRRLVRTLSVDLEKTVSFRVLNELGTLDRDDYARCQTVLDHMVRNALDHGIEPADERVAAGKPAEGLVTIDIRKAGADSIITLTDDGRGIDPRKMRESAVRKGLDVDVEALSDAEAARLIFHKGFTTANAVSQISGRGVGMDIVLNEIQEMGGDIQIDSQPGYGTSFHIRVPSSVTVNGALLVSAGEQSYAIPLGGLIAVEQVPVDEFFSAVQNNTRLSLAGMECEPTYLATLCQSGHSLDAKTWQHSVPVIIAGSAERYMAVAVDDVEEALELVIRSLGAQFATVPGVAGAATTASGEAIVALDLNLLVASVAADDQSCLRVDASRDEGLLVMVVDDSRTQRMVATGQLDTVGVQTVTAENGAVAIDLLNSADRLPDVILMDVEMPVKDGIQALREIRKSVRYGHVPVIMITSRTGLKHRAMAQAAGCNGYMGKPFNFRMLVGQINQLTGHRLQLS